MSKNKYTIITKKSLADTINFLTGMKYFIYNDKESNKAVFSFENTKEFNLALNKILKFRDDLRKEI